jgi:hypothetical protein
MRHRTFDYWPTRIMLGAALLAPVAVALIYLAAPQPLNGPMTSDILPGVEPVMLAAGAVLWLVGIVWMLRIFRGPRDDEAPAWRYRDR